MGRLLVASNRLPVSLERKGKKFELKPSVGGLATGMSSLGKSFDVEWVGWPGLTAGGGKQATEIRKILAKEKCHPVFLSEEDMDDFYHGFCNEMIWPLFHYFNEHAIYNTDYWDAYVRVNELFSEAIMSIAKPNDTFWIHDYHLMLLPRLIRNKKPDASIGFFLHIPFPSFEIFRLLPWRLEVLDGILGADLIGFHTYDYVRYFLDSVRSLLGYESTYSQVASGTRMVKVDAFPMGIDYERFAKTCEVPGVEKEIKNILTRTEGCKIILSIDRLDYTKGILERLKSFEFFLNKNPDYVGKVIFILKVVSSRTGVSQYSQLKKKVDEIVGQINGKYRTFDWEPIWYLYRFLSTEQLASLYCVADIALITPLRDGMNLVAKEYLATKTHGQGCLILSEMAGAAKELGEALIVNPNNMTEIADTIKEALTMPEDEQIEKNRIMQDRLRQYDVNRWTTNFMDALSKIKIIQKELYASRLTKEVEDKLVKDAKKSAQCLLLLDYDGTLIPFSTRPEITKPDDELLELLDGLSRKKGNEIVIVSGRDKKTMADWFGDLNVGLIAEHGVWLKPANNKWEMIEPLRDDWKEEIQPILQSYVDRTQGTFIEEKGFSLVWHYRKADATLGIARASELIDDLVHLTSNLNLEILEGNKVIEVKNAGINKGRATLQWLSKKNWDFILAAGDDVTDEDFFAILPDLAYSIKVGLAPSQAKFNLDSIAEMRSLLKELVKA